MAARQLFCPYQPLCFATDVSIIRLNSEVVGSIVIKLCHMFDGDTDCIGDTRLLCGCANYLERPVVRLAVDFQTPSFQMASESQQRKLTAKVNSLFYRRVCVT